ncbi:MAG TPA: 50S ribosomal protein L4 [Gaiellaceae bacterium]|jgi:large subunit ribosomal protein L4|nr:50S ribosomal protein L4 [Gaiellaceae bacterium]
MAKVEFLGKSGTVEVEDAVFGAEVKPHLVHEAVRAEQNALRAGTAATKSRGLVSGGRAKPWRQKGTGRARQGTIRAPQFSGGGHAFAKVPRTFVQKVNRKAARAALRSAFAGHASAGTVAVVSADQFDQPSTKAAKALLEGWGKQTPTVVIALQEEENIEKSFRNLDRVAVISPGELEVGAVVWARSLVISEGALPLVQGRAV